MAAGKRGAGPGTYTENGVVCTMGSPFKAGKNMGEQSDMSGTFDAPRTGGGNGLPTHVMDTDLKAGAKTPKPGFASSAPSKDLT